MTARGEDREAIEVLDFWFGPEPVPSAAVTERWFKRDPAFDDEIRRRFGALHAAAAAGRHDGWAATPRGALALIVVLDQFSRNLFRDRPEAFAQDARALPLAQALRADPRVRELTFHQRGIALLPLEHAEDREVQAESVAAFAALRDEAAAAGAPAGVVDTLAYYLDYAERHRVIIDRFGRFPHRNEVLGRASTAEELAFLAQPGSRF